MSDLLDRLESALQEVEDQLLAEFERIHKTLSGEPYSSLDSDVKYDLNETVMGLWHELEHSGDWNNLTLRSEQHENLSIRIIVLKKLLDAKIPTAFLAETQEQVEQSRGSVKTKSTPGKNVAQSEVTAEESTGFFETIMQFFRGKPAPDDASRITEEEEESEKEKIETYLDSGVYAAQHLAELADRFQTDGDDKDIMNAAASGKAMFESKELSEADAMKKKLDSAAHNTGGASTFKARELSTTVPPIPSKPVAPVAEKQAQTPDEIRKKLEARQGGSSSSGKASFSSKDIEHATPREVPRDTEKEPVKKEPAERPTGKAVFESKDLSSPDEK